MRQMKKLTLAGLALASMSLLGGCLDLSENPVSGVTEEFFGTAEGADAAITGAYARLRDYYGQEQEMRIGFAGTDAGKGGEQCVGRGWGGGNG